MLPNSELAELARRLIHRAGEDAAAIAACADEAASQLEDGARRESASRCIRRSLSLARGLRTAASTFHYRGVSTAAAEIEHSIESFLAGRPPDDGAFARRFRELAGGLLAEAERLAHRDATAATLR